MMKSLSSVFILCLLGATAVTQWTRVGDASHVALRGGDIELNVPEGSTAGALSTPITVNGDVVIVQADFKEVSPRGVTLSLQDVKNGESIAYWQNPLFIDGESTVDAVVAISRRADAGRLFVGSDRIASRAKVSKVTYRMSTRQTSMRGSSYGALVDSEHAASQSFVPRKQTLDAIRFRVRQLNDADGPGLRVELFSAPPDNASAKPVVSRIIPRSALPLPATGEIDLGVVLNAQVVPGRLYQLKWSPADVCSHEQAILLFSAADCNPSGVRYENGKSIENQDMFLETFESD